MKFLISSVCCLVVLFVTVAKPVEACTCVPTSDQRVFRRAETVFSAVVTEAKLPPERDIPGQVTLKVMKIWKGNPGQTVVMEQKLTSCDVWRSAKVGDEFLVFAVYHRIGGDLGLGFPPTSSLTTDQCRRTRPMRLATTQKLLGPGKNP